MVFTVVHEALSVKANFDALAGTNLSFYVKVQGKNVGKKGIRAARVPLNWNGPIGSMASGMVQEGLDALSDWLHTSFSMSRDEYKEMVTEFPREWTEYQTVINYHVVYFQVTGKSAVN
ncbi:hypothetical protein HK100_003621 [Physocladia obscura]|uniref:Uncharacterized protein n=1 Tax=Physocladia obscura TaxID=109957 RepID=A0AAD5X998_9FUNG|nr:hypothetical protein HK100_003621 [Physocladia obscura]